MGNAKYNKGFRKGKRILSVESDLVVATKQRYQGLETRNYRHVRGVYGDLPNEKPKVTTQI